jgi:broad specificity phosphatase PhoE
MAFRTAGVLIGILCSIALLHAQSAHNYLANSTLLVIRHAEKPATGASLTPEGIARAEKYARYFHPFVIDGARLSINALYAGSDEKDSMRPRLTLEPLSQATGIQLNTKFSTADSDVFAHALIEEVHGDHVLIAWRHKKIPVLLKALGADPTHLLPDGVWPDSVYDWVIFLHFDAAGQLDQQRLIHEPDPLP